MRRNKLEAEKVADKNATKIAREKVAKEKADQEKKRAEVIASEKVGILPIKNPSDLIKIATLKKDDSFCFRTNRFEYYVYAGKKKNRFAYHHKNRPEKLYFENRNQFVIKEKKKD